MIEQSGSLKDHLKTAIRALEQILDNENSLPNNEKHYISLQTAEEALLKLPKIENL